MCDSLGIKSECKILVVEDKQQSFPWSITSPSSLSAPTIPTATISPSSVQQQQQQQSQPITENTLQLHNLANNVDTAQLIAQQQQQHPRQGSGSS